MRHFIEFICSTICRCALWECENVKRVCVQIIITSSNICWLQLTSQHFGLTWHVPVSVCVCTWVCRCMAKANYDCLTTSDIFLPIWTCFEFRPTTKIEWYQLLTRPNCVTLINTSAKRKPTIKFVHLVNNYENSVYTLYTLRCSFSNPPFIHITNLFHLLLHSLSSSPIFLFILAPIFFP